MRIQTTRFGTIEVNESSMLRMPEGMLGFEHCRRFALLEEEPDSVFKWLQSLDDPALAFVLINPFDFFPDYDVELTDEQAEILDLDDPEDAVMFTTVTVSREAGKVTTNLAGPIVMNRRTLRMRQIVFQDDNYSTKAVIGEMPCASTDKELVKAA